MKHLMFTSVALLAIFWMGLAPLHAQEKSFSGGAGTAESPWQISTPADLNNMRNYLGDAHSDKHFVLINDIDLTDATRDGGAYWNDGAGWNPIGPGSWDALEGTFDGDGHVITGLFINRPTQNHVGLFGFVVGGTIKNIGLEGADITGEALTGALVGQNNGGMINSSYATGVVTGETGGWIGGLAGFNGSGGQVLSSYSEITVSIGPEPGMNMGAGGLVGNNAGTISMSFATGDISTTEVVQFIGGLVGRNEGADAIISQSFATGNVSSGGGYLGGLVGLNWPSTAKISQSFATGNAINASGSSTDDNIRVGGLAGDNYGIIEQSYALGNAGAYTDVGGLVGFNRNDAHVSGAYATGQRTRGSRFGGIAGFNEGNIENAYWDKQASGITDGLGGESGTSSNIIGIETTAAMQGSAAATNMALFDFVDMWETVAGAQPDATADGYPILQVVPRLDQLQAQGKLQMRSLSLGRDPVAGGTVSGDGSHGVFAEVPISADTHVGYLFTGWTGDTDHLADAEAESTTVTMPNQDIILTANFKTGIAWTGGADTDFGNAANWNTGVAPDASDNVRINVVPNETYPVVDDARSVQDLEIMAGAQLTLGIDAELTVSGLLDNRAGASDLVIQSSVAGSGSLIHATPGVEATVQRYVPAAGAWVTGKDAATDWYFLSSPVSNQAIDPGFIPGVGGYDIFRFGETNNIWENYVIAGFTHFAPGLGYLVAYENAQDLVFEGELNVGEVLSPLMTHTAEGAQGYNLLGNPYASAIDWSAATKTQFADNFAYVYNTAKIGGPGYETIGHDHASAGDHIAAHQAFFVELNPASHDEAFTFTNALRVHGPDFMKTTPPQGLVLRLSKEDYYDETTLLINEQASFARDRHDARKFFSFSAQVPQLYSLTSDAVLVSINAIPQVNEEVEIALGMRLPADGEYSLSLQEFGGAFEDVPLLLKDKKEGVVHDLKSSPTYIFMDDGGDLTDRFALLFYRDVTSVEDPVGGTDDLTRIYVYGQTLYMEFSSGDADRVLEVFDTSGRLLLRNDLGAGSRFSCGLNLQPGVYVVRVSGPQGMETRRIALP